MESGKSHLACCTVNTSMGNERKKTYQGHSLCPHSRTPDCLGNSADCTAPSARRWNENNETYLVSGPSSTSSSLLATLHFNRGDKLTVTILHQHHQQNFIMGILGLTLYVCLYPWPSWESHQFFSSKDFFSGEENSWQVVFNMLLAPQHWRASRTWKSPQFTSTTTPIWCG